MLLGYLLQIQVNTPKNRETWNIHIGKSQIMSNMVAIKMSYRFRFYKMTFDNVLESWRECSSVLCWFLVIYAARLGSGRRTKNSTRERKERGKEEREKGGEGKKRGERKGMEHWHKQGLVWTMYKAPELTWKGPRDKKKGIWRKDSEKRQNMHDVWKEKYWYGNGF